MRKHKGTALHSIKTASAVIMCLFLLMTAFPLATAANNNDTGKTVRVGWYYSTYKLTESTLYTLARSDDQKSFTPTDNITTAVEKDNLNYDSILMDYYPNWHKLECDSVQDCLKAVSEGKADCFLISS